MSPYSRPFSPVLLAAALCAPALAIDDRDNVNKTGWAVYYGQSASQITTIINAGYRLVDLEVEVVSPLTFTAAFVANSGTYQPAGWWWLANVDATTLSNFLGTNGARIIDLEVFQLSGATRFAAVMVSNTGSFAKTWYWYFNQASPTAISNLLTANNARPIDIEQYVIGTTTYYAVVMVNNQGANFKAYWHWYGATPAFIANQIATNGSRVYDLEPVGSAYNVILVRDTGIRWWYYYGVSGGDILDVCGSHSARPMCIRRRGSVFDLVLLNNANPLEDAVSQIMRSNSDGVMGAYLKRANGAVLAGFNHGRIFEPASTLKTLHHVHTMKRVLNATATLTQNLTVNTGLINNSCPNDTMPVTQTLEVVLSNMMEASSNAHTKAITLFNGGFTPLNTTAAALGMTSTLVQHHIGCGTPPNQLTLVDLGRLHEAVVNGYLGSYRQKFYDLMPNSLDGYGDGNYLGLVLGQEAATVGLTATQLTTFKSNCEIAWKRGGYGTATGFHRTYGGWVSIPFYGNGGITNREYVTGAYCVEASNDANAQMAAGKGAADLLRLEIRAAMQTWKDHVFGSLTAFGTPCQGTAGVPLHSVSGTPEIGQFLSYSLTGARATTPSVMYVGTSKTQWGTVMLPLSLAFLGAPLCNLYTNPLVPLTATTSAGGDVTFRIQLPLNQGMIGGSFHTQFVIYDPGANAGSLVSTRGMTTLVGGQN
jgi:hypothetical protein